MHAEIVMPMQHKIFHVSTQAICSSSIVCVVVRSTKELFRIADWSSLRRDGLETRQLIQLQAIFLVWPEFHSEFVTAYRRGGLLEAGRSLMSRVGRMFGGKVRLACLPQVAPHWQLVGQVVPQLMPY